MGPKQKAAIAEARKKLKGYSWFTGVCIDSLPHEEYCERNFEEVVEQMIFETWFWDGM